MLDTEKLKAKVEGGKLMIPHNPRACLLFMEWIAKQPAYQTNISYYQGDYFTYEVKKTFYNYDDGFLNKQYKQAAKYINSNL